MPRPLLRKTDVLINGQISGSACPVPNRQVWTTIVPDYLSLCPEKENSRAHEVNPISPLFVLYGPYSAPDLSIGLLWIPEYQIVALAAHCQPLRDGFQGFRLAGFSSPDLTLLVISATRHIDVRYIHRRPCHVVYPRTVIHRFTLATVSILHCSTHLPSI